jgi:hypothetical protein
MTPHLPFDATHERITELRAVAAAARRDAHGTERTPGDSAIGPLERAREALGLRLIELGAALVRDEHRPPRLARR